MYYPIAGIILNFLVFLLVLFNTDFTNLFCQHSANGKYIYNIVVRFTGIFPYFYIFKDAIVKMFLCNVYNKKRNARIVG